MYYSPHTAEKRISFVLECLQSWDIKATCEKHRLTQRTFYNWKEEFIKGAIIHMGNEYLFSDDSFIKACREKLLKLPIRINKKLQKENEKLRQLITHFQHLGPKHKIVYTLQDKQMLMERMSKTILRKGKAARILGITCNTLRTWKIERRKRILSDRKVVYRKTQNEFYKKQVINLLHQSPLNYQLPRTNWSLTTLKSVLATKGVQIGLATIRNIINDAGFQFRHAKMVLTSTDPEYTSKVKKLKKTLSHLRPDEAFFSIDEYGPFIIKQQGGHSWTAPGVRKIYLGHQKVKGVIIMTAALELKTNQVTHFYSKTKNTTEMLKLIKKLNVKYSDMKTLYLSWDAAQWHSSKELLRFIELQNKQVYLPKIILVPLPVGAPFLNLIESVFSGMSKSVIHNSNYQSKGECVKALNRYFRERNKFYLKNPGKVGKTIWDKEHMNISFSESNNCKSPQFHKIRRKRVK